MQERLEVAVGGGEPRPLLDLEHELATGGAIGAGAEDDDPLQRRLARRRSRPAGMFAASERPERSSPPRAAGSGADPVRCAGQRGAPP